MDDVSDERFWWWGREQEELSLGLISGVIEKRLEFRADARILNLVPGTGHIEQRLTDYHKQVHSGITSSQQREFLLKKIQPWGAPEHLRFHENLDPRDLSRFGDGSFDVVIALGPFYETLISSERDTIRKEVARVLTPGGSFYSTFKTRRGTALSTLLDPDEWKSFEDLKILVQLGLPERHANDEIPETLQTCYFTTPEEMRAEFEAVGIRQADLLAPGGLAACVSDSIWEKIRSHDDAGGRGFDMVDDLAWFLARDPGTFAYSPELLFIGVKE